MLDQSTLTIKQVRQQAKMAVYKLPDCQICLQPLDNDLIALTCGHVFHRECLEENQMHRKECCACKKSYRNQNVIGLYFETQKKTRFVLGSKQALEDPEVKYAVRKFDQKMRKNRIYERYELLKEKFIQLKKNHHKLSEEHHQAIERIDFLEYQLEGFNLEMDQDQLMEDYQDMDDEDNWSADDDNDQEDEGEEESEEERELINNAQKMENQINRYLGIAVNQAVENNGGNINDESDRMVEQSQEEEQSNENQEESNYEDLANSKESSQIQGRCQGCGRKNCQPSQSQYQQERQCQSSQSLLQNSSQKLSYPIQKPSILLNKPLSPSTTTASHSHHQQKLSYSDLTTELQQKIKQLSKLKQVSLEFQLQATAKIQQSTQTVKKQEQKIGEMSQTIKELNRRIIEMNDKFKIVDNACENFKLSWQALKYCPYKITQVQEEKKQQSQTKSDAKDTKKLVKVQKVKKISKPTKNKQIKRQRTEKTLSIRKKNIIPRVRILRQKLFQFKL